MENRNKPFDKAHFIVQNESHINVRVARRRTSVNEKRNDTKSLVMLIGSMLIFGTVGIFRRYIPLPSALLHMKRGMPFNMRSNTPR